MPFQPASMAGKHSLISPNPNRSFSLLSSFLIFTFSLLALVFVFFLISSSPYSSDFIPLSPNPNPKPNAPLLVHSFLASLEKFLTSGSFAPSPSSDTAAGGGDESVERALDDAIWRRETGSMLGDPLETWSGLSVARVYVYEMPAKFTYDLLWLFWNSYRDTGNLTSNGSPVHRLIEQHSIDYWLWADLISPQSTRLLKNVIRVHRQEEADFFYIPFFSTISYFLLERQQCKALYRVWKHPQDDQCSLRVPKETMTRTETETSTSAYEDQIRDYRRMARLRNEAARYFRRPQRGQRTLESLINPDQQLAISQQRRANMVPAEEEVNMMTEQSTIEPVTYSRRSLLNRLYNVEEALKWVTDQPAWKRSEGRDHILPVHHPWSFKSVRRYMKKAIWILPDMDSTGNWYKAGQVWLEKDLILPYVPNVDFCDAKCLSETRSMRNTLLFFRGRLKRNAGGKVRSKLVAVLQDIEDVIIEEGSAGIDGKEAAQDGMRKSIFCLSPAGDTPSSARLFDAIVSGCIPVIVSDEIELPFEGLLDYRKIALIVSSSDAVQPGWLVKFLKGIDSRQIKAMQLNLAKYSRHFLYSNPAQPLGAVDFTWRMIAGKLVNIKLHIRRSQRMVKGSRNLCTCECMPSNISLVR